MHIYTYMHIHIYITTDIYIHDYLINICKFYFDTRSITNLYLGLYKLLYTNYLSMVLKQMFNQGS